MIKPNNSQKNVQKLKTNGVSLEVNCLYQKQRIANYNSNEKMSKKYFHNQTQNSITNIKNKKCERLIQTKLKCVIQKRNKQLFIKVIKQLNQQQSKINIKGLNIIFFLIQKFQIDLIKELLKINPFSIQQRNKFLQTPLIASVKKQYYQIIKILLKNKASINASDNSGSTALHYACKLKNQRILKLLLLNVNINVECCNSFGKMPADYCNEQMLKILEISIKKNKQNLELNINKQKINNNNIVKTSSKKSIHKTLITFQGVNKNLYDQFTLNKKIDIKDIKLICLIGKGTFGQVYLSKYKNNVIAIKILDKKFILKNKLLSYIKSQKNILASINNPFIVDLKFSFQTHDKLGLALQYAQGGDLSSYVGKATEQQIKLWAAQITLAIQIIHQHNVIYRDLKPENVLINKYGGAVLTDFGLVRQNINQNIKGASSFCGSYAYLAPQMVKRIGHGKVIDWYMLGVMLYQLLTGNPPFYCLNKNQMLNNIIKEQLRFPQKLNISDELKDLIQNVKQNNQLMKKNPVQRLGSQLDAQEVKQHAFFKDLNWDSIFNKQHRKEVKFNKKKQSITKFNQQLTNIVLTPYNKNFTPIEDWDTY